MSNPEQGSESAQSWYYRGLELVQQRLRSVRADLTERARCAHQVADEMGEASPLQEQLECSRGCSYCCYFPVGVTEAEAMAILQYLRDELSPAAMASLELRCMAEADDRAALDWEALASQKRPCVLLADDGSCLTYDARPVACRGWRSTSRDSCHEHFGGGQQARPRLDAPAYLSCLGVHEGLAAACTDVEDGVAETRELTEALRRILRPSPVS